MAVPPNKTGNGPLTAQLPPARFAKSLKPGVKAALTSFREREINVSVILNVAGFQETLSG
jgi:hypothetical protein